MSLKRGIYYGRNKDIYGKTALLRDTDESKGYVLAQFDDLQLPMKYTHNWAKLRRENFKFKEEE